MGIGDPIGRSAGNPSKLDARRRFSENERLQRIPSLDETTFPVDAEPRGLHLTEIYRRHQTRAVWCLLAVVAAVLILVLVL